METFKIALLLIALVVAAIVCYRCIRDGKVGPQFGLKWSTDDEPGTSAPKAETDETAKPACDSRNCRFLLVLYLLCLSVLGGCAIMIFLGTKDVEICVAVLLALASSCALSYIGHRIRRQCPETAKKMVNPFF